MTASPNTQVGEFGQPAPGESFSPGVRAFRKIIRKPSVILSLAFLALIVLLAIFAPLVTRLSGWDPFTYDEAAVDPSSGGLPLAPLGGMSAEHWLGVEPQNGRDIFARIAYGARVSLLVGICATAITMLLGVVMGLLAGFFGGIVDAVISRLMDFLMAFPALIFMIAILSALPQGNRPALLVIVLSIFSWPATARVIRAQTMSLANREFVEAARTSGAGWAPLVFREVLPNLSGTIIVMATLAIPNFIATEAGLSFLGVGITPPNPSWGQMIASAVPWYSSDPMFFAIPGILLFLTVFAFTVLGDNLQKIFSGGFE
ncbi:ABC transporter permease [Brevibacterium sp. 50QC2O2]|jgi:peptide/nickel transport system permease protein|uniref:ABC transporter permease n=1 Tax=Brevibacterium sp. 50QC2O2 TaxID=2968459 RepID=UPI00211BDD93|nr:ABC transporter permease [Brevibacterium sp. 50QC2O2]MCQ9389740.1 ABC transporter permease [Brevibacterium sp. 50QC2O2]